MNFYNWMQKKYCFTNYQIKVFHYFVISMFSEISKFLIMGIFFYATEHLPYYLWGVCLLSILRFYGGGLHCKTYMGCLLSSFLYMLICINLLPFIPITKLFQLVLLLIAIIIAYYIAPIPSVYRPSPTEEKSKQCKLQLFIIIFLYSILVFIFPQNLFILTGFWVIMIHTLQLIAAHLQRR